MGVGHVEVAVSRLEVTDMVSALRHSYIPSSHDPRSHSLNPVGSKIPGALHATAVGQPSGK